MRPAGAIAALLLALCIVAPTSLNADQVHMPEMVPPPSRDVTPSGVTPAPITSGPLIREPLPPLPPEKPGWHRFFLPETTDAATFVVGTRTIRLAGVTAVPRDVSCKLADGSEWPCGTTALFALRRFLQGRAIECDFMASDKTNPVVAPCRMGKTDIALWLLGGGWVTAEKTAPDEYRKTAQAAHCAGLGLWRGTAKGASCAATN
jgi:endonuclease YncB( thermonuclease family)